MKRVALSTIRILILAFFVLAVSSPRAFAQRDTAAVELFGGYFDGDSAHNGVKLDQDPTYGMRLSHRVTSNIAVEGALTRTRDFITSYHYELSAKVYLPQQDRIGLFVLGGLGDQRISDQGVDNNITTLHLGVGAEIALSERFYLRPQILARWPKNNTLTESYRTADYTLGFGWRF